MNFDLMSSHSELFAQSFYQDLTSMALSIINRSMEQGAEDLRDWLPLKAHHP